MCVQKSLGLFSLCWFLRASPLMVVKFFREDFGSSNQIQGICLDKMRTRPEGGSKGYSLLPHFSLLPLKEHFSAPFLTRNTRSQSFCVPQEVPNSYSSCTRRKKNKREVPIVIGACVHLALTLCPTLCTRTCALAAFFLTTSPLKGQDSDYPISVLREGN